MKINYGNIEFKTTGTGYKVSYMGSMGNTMDDVNQSLSKVGLPCIIECKEEIRDIGGRYIEKGSPDYRYTFEYISPNN